MNIQVKNTETVIFSTVLDMWLSSNLVHIKHTTYDKYNYIIEKHIVPELGDYPIESLNSVAINKFLHDKLQHGGVISGEPLAASYVCTMSLIISSAMKFAANEDLCPFIKNRIFKPNETNKEIRILDKQDYKKLIEYSLSKTDESTIGILLALFSGLRIGEICALKWDDIDFKKKTIFVHSTISRLKSENKIKYALESAKTKASVRIIPIPKRFLECLKNAYKIRKSDFVISDNESFVIPRTFEYRYKKILCKLDIEIINFHSLRHTFATNCVTNGMDVKSLSEILGHSSINTTMQIYVHPSIELKRRQINKIFQ